MKGAKSDIEILWSRLRDMAGSAPFRNRTWREHVGKRDCVFCQGPADEAHHLFGSFGPLKTSDIFIVPICRRCHDTRAEAPENKAFLLEEWIRIAKETIEQGLVA